MEFSITSTEFQQGEEIPTKFTCEGRDHSPSLAWTAGPSDTRSFVLIVDDPDAPDPDAPKMTWVHWLLFNLPASSRGLSEAIESNELPVGTGEGINDWKRTGYGGPCPPIGRHRYFFKLYALDTMLTLDRPTKPALERAMHGHILAETVLMGTYQKQRK